MIEVHFSSIFLSVSIFFNFLRLEITVPTMRSVRKIKNKKSIDLIVCEAQLFPYVKFQSINFRYYFPAELRSNPNDEILLINLLNLYVSSKQFAAAHKKIIEYQVNPALHQSLEWHRCLRKVYKVCKIDWIVLISYEGRMWNKTWGREAQKYIRGKKWNSLGHKKGIFCTIVSAIFFFKINEKLKCLPKPCVSVLRSGCLVTKWEGTEQSSCDTRKK